jgi:surfeit locus 1 family protein
MAQRSARTLIVPGIAVLIVFAILCGLGVWQVQRLAWKEALIARVDSRLDDPPVPAPGPADWAALDLAEREYQPVSLTGRYLNDREARIVYVLTAPKGPVGGVGYLVMTPFRTDEGWIAYVNRGFVPQANAAPETRAAGQIEGETTVTGLLRHTHGRSWFDPADDPAGNAWFSRDPKVWAAAAGLPAAEIAPYIVDAGYDPALPGGLPQGGETLVTFPNSHLGYAITWFGLAAALVAVFFVYVRRKKSE